MEANKAPTAKSGWETPGSFTIMAIYLGLFVVMWLLSFAYLAARWAIS